MIILTLLPCPFCGNPDPYTGKRGLGGQHLIHCSKCGASGPPAQNISDAAAKWNRRPYREAVRASQQAREKTEFDQLFNPGVES